MSSGRSMIRPCLPAARALRNAVLLRDNEFVRRFSGEALCKVEALLLQGVFAAESPALLLHRAAGNVPRDTQSCNCYFDILISGDDLRGDIQRRLFSPECGPPSVSLPGHA